MHCRTRFAAALVVAGSSFAAHGQAVVSERTISTSAAQEAATAALEQCRKDGYRVTVTVVNRAGRAKVVLHDDGSGPHTIENSLRKAYTTVTFRVPSGEIGKRVAANPGGAGTLHLANVTGAAGALPILSNKEVIGAIGVSGAPGGDKDEVCAQAGIDRIAKGLAGG
ncbi:MAG: GlcG/HbpS family heme-binding protein [Burkholderiales bacterium]